MSSVTQFWPTASKCKFLTNWFIMVWLFLIWCDYTNLTWYYLSRLDYRRLSDFSSVDTVSWLGYTTILWSRCNASWSYGCYITQWSHSVCVKLLNSYNAVCVFLDYELFIYFSCNFTDPAFSFTSQCMEETREWNGWESVDNVFKTYNGIFCVLASNNINSLRFIIFDPSQAGKLMQHHSKYS